VDGSDIPGVERLLTLSDGVVAIALTLLVLQLKVPHIEHADSASDLASSLSQMGSSLTSYLVSFYVIAQFWLAHHRTFRQVAGHDEGLAWWNFFFLFTISVMPFTSELLGTYADNPVAVDIFALNLLLASLSTQMVLVFARRKGLIVPGTPRAHVLVARFRGLALMAVVAVSMAVAWVNPSLAKFMWILMIPVPFVADRWVRAVSAHGPEGGAASRAPATP